MTTATLSPIFPITALSKDVKNVKAAADKELVRITENGRGAYVFASEEVLASIIEKEREDAAYEAYVMEQIDQGIADIEAGRVYTSTEEMFAEVARRRARKAQAHE